MLATLGIGNEVTTAKDPPGDGLAPLKLRVNRFAWGLVQLQSTKAVYQGRLREDLSQPVFIKVIQDTTHCMLV